MRYSFYKSIHGLYFEGEKYDGDQFGTETDIDITTIAFDTKKGLIEVPKDCYDYVMRIVDSLARELDENEQLDWNSENGNHDDYDDARKE